jgi:glyoxylase-like metal-dependent hydrolase (beta-lactamase superfamily II)
MEVAVRIHRLNDVLVNFYVVEDGGKVTLIDSGVKRHWALLLAKLRELGLGLSDIEAVVLTHAHLDHMGCAETARRESGATVYVHDDDLDLARGAASPHRERSLFSYGFGPAARLIWYFASKGAFRFPKVAIASTFADGETLDVPGRPRVIHVPGHTAGSSALHLEERDALACGDAIITRSIFTGSVGPQIAPSALNMNSRQALESLSRLEGVVAKYLLPGHGEPFGEGVDAAVALAKQAGLP